MLSTIKSRNISLDKSLLLRKSDAADVEFQQKFVVIVSAIQHLLKYTLFKYNIGPGVLELSLSTSPPSHVLCGAPFSPYFSLNTFVQDVYISVKFFFELD
jgi:hypothetical protein